MSLCLDIDCGHTDMGLFKVQSYASIFHVDEYLNVSEKLKAGCKLNVCYTQ